MSQDIASIELPYGKRRSLRMGILGMGGRFAVGLLMSGLLVGAFPSPVFADGLTVSVGGGGNGSTASAVIQLLALTTAIALAPGLLAMCTAFTRIIVLSLLRQAIGLQQTPPNVVLVGMGMFLTAYVMGPTFEKAWGDGIRPLMDGAITEEQAFERTIEPFRGFMEAHARPKDIALFIDLSGPPVKPGEAGPSDIKEDQAKAAHPPWTVLMPAFMVSEVRRAFEIGFTLFLPFLIIDLVVAGILMSMGMMMLPPAVVALPFKIIFFTLADGWAQVAGALVRSYGG